MKELDKQENAGLPGWTEVHDLALIYLTCMHGTDDQIDATEMDAARVLIARHLSVEDEQLVSKIINDALLMYVSDSGQDMLLASILSLGDSFTADQRIGVLRDLADLVAADGMVYPEEIQFIANLAEQWDVKNFFSQGN